MSGPTGQPVCIVCDGAGCEFCPTSYLARALVAVLEGRPNTPIEIGDGLHIRADIVVRNVAPQALDNIEARKRLGHLRVAS